jgi:hypothetical protein
MLAESGCLQRRNCCPDSACRPKLAKHSSTLLSIQRRSTHKIESALTPSSAVIRKISLDYAATRRLKP